MAFITIQSETTKDPITLIGKEAGICYGSDISDHNKNYKRGMDCILSNHGRTLEYPQVYFIADGYSARMMREFYTHIGGMPTRIQASSRYIDYRNFEYYIPDSLTKDHKSLDIYHEIMQHIQEGLIKLDEIGIPREDVANLLPLGMCTKVVVRTNLRNLSDMSHQRMCNRAYSEYRQFMKDLANALSDYSHEWEECVRLLFKPKCELTGYCTEKNSCGRKPKKV